MLAFTCKTKYPFQQSSDLMSLAINSPVECLVSHFLIGFEIIDLVKHGSFCHISKCSKEIKITLSDHYFFIIGQEWNFFVFFSAELAIITISNTIYFLFMIIYKNVYFFNGMKCEYHMSIFNQKLYVIESTTDHKIADQFFDLIIRCLSFFFKFKEVPKVIILFFLMFLLCP